MDEAATKSAAPDLCLLHSAKRSRCGRSPVAMRHLCERVWTKRNCSRICRGRREGQTTISRRNVAALSGCAPVPLDKNRMSVTSHRPAQASACQATERLRMLSERQLHYLESAAGSGRAQDERIL